MEKDNENNHICCYNNYGVPSTLSYKNFRETVNTFSYNFDRENAHRKY